jgi:sulfur-carrier protein
VKVHIPSPLLSYTTVSEVEAEGGSLAEVLADLDHRFPGFRFRVVDEQDRVRAHMRFFVNGVQAFDLATKLTPRDEVQLVQALSGG